MSLEEEGVVLSISADQEDNCSEQSLESQYIEAKNAKDKQEDQQDLRREEAQGKKEEQQTCSNKTCNLYVFNKENMKKSINLAQHLCLSCRRQYQKQEYCFYCKQIYFQETDDGMIWIMCDACLKWMHLKCIDQQATLDQFQQGFLCEKCNKSGEDEGWTKGGKGNGQWFKQLGVERRKVKECTLNKFGFYWELSNKELLQDLQKLNQLIK